MTINCQIIGHTGIHWNIYFRMLYVRLHHVLWWDGLLLVTVNDNVSSSGYTAWNESTVNK